MQNESAMQETPYTIPKDWKWETLGNYITLHRGVSYKKDEAKTQNGENDVLIMRGGNVKEGFLDLEDDNVYVDKSLVAESQFVKENDVIIVSSTGSTQVIGRAGVAFQSYNDVAFGAFLTLARPSKDVYPKYIDFFFQGSIYRNRIRELAAGVNINNIRKEYITDTPLPLPPIAEQERIVGRIEKLFADLDAAKEKVQTVLEQSAERKAAILHQAFTGTLTTAWRKKNKQLVVKNEELRIETSEKPYNIPDSWIWVKGKSIFNEMESIKPTGEYFNYIDIESVDNTNQTVSAPKVIETSKAPSRASRKLHDGDTIFSMVRPYLKNIAYINEDLKDCIASTGFFIASPKEFVDSEYLFQLMKSPFVINGINSFMRGDNSPSVRKNDIEDFCYPLPTLPEQSEIVSLLDSLLGAEKTIAENCQTVLDKISDIKKAILAKAFRGLL